MSRHTVDAAAVRQTRRPAFLRPVRIGLAVLIVLAALVLRPVTNSALQPPPHKAKIDKALQQALKDHKKALRVIVRTDAGKRDVVADALRKGGKKITHSYATVSAVSAELDADDVEDLANDPDVVGLSTDAVVTTDLSSEAADGDPLPQNAVAETLGLDGVRYTGKDVGIAVIDSGIQKGVDIDGPRADKFWDFTDGGRHEHPADDYGHGTHVAGLIVGTGKGSHVKVTALDKNGKRVLKDRALYEGIAPDARLINLKVLGPDGSGYTSAVLEAIDFAIDNKDRLGIDVINLSLGHPIYEPAEDDPLVIAVEQAARAGIVVVTSAGNYGRNVVTGEPGYAGITSPGNAPSAITVGAFDGHGTATRSDDTIPTYSSRGPSWYNAFAKPDVVAPGHALVAAAAEGSTLYADHPERQVFVNDKTARYLRLSGTSMAAAVTSGVVALMLQANHDGHYHAALTPNAVKAILQYSALPMSGYDYLTQGTGGLNGAGAVAFAAEIDPAVPAGGYWLASPVATTTTIDGQDLQWAQTVVWGTTVVWGNLVEFNQPLWSQTVVWGTRVVWGDTVVWGTRVVWGETVVWGNTVVWGTTVVLGNTVVWGNAVWDSPSVWGSTVVWGNTSLTVDGSSISPETVVWGNLADVFDKDR